MNLDSWLFITYLKYLMFLLNITEVQNKKSIPMITSHSTTSNPYNAMSNPKLEWRYLQKKKRLK